MNHLTAPVAFLTYNTLVVAVGVAAVGCAAGVVGTFGVLRKRALVGDAAAHATLVGVATALLLTGQRDLAVLLVGGLLSAMVAIVLLVFIRKFTRTRDDAATAIVLSVSFGLGITLISGMVSRGVPGSGGLERFLLGHTASLTVNDALLLGIVSVVGVLCIVVGLKEATLVAFDSDFAAAAGWPAATIDLVLIGLIAVMVVVGLPAAGAVLVTALVVIPPAVARQWTERLIPMLVIAGLVGLFSGLVGVVLSSLAVQVPTGPVVVLVATAFLIVSILVAPCRGILWRTQSLIEMSPTVPTKKEIGRSVPRGMEQNL
ncbi:MAG: metal ABC transporter permease [Planctomycetota bacterium]|nr:metal ABC transporter permease [Planctomycetota bacterium]